MAELAETQYLDIMQELVNVADVVDEPRKDRTGVGTVNMFAQRIEVGPCDTPVLLTKRVFFTGVLDELFWFLRGSTNVNDLTEARKWWEPFAGPGGSLGPLYGAQLRGGGEGMVDQLKTLLHGLRTFPESRRHILSTWDAHRISEMRLPPCHGIVTQFQVDPKGRLAMQTYQRSADWFLGVPCNLASYAVLHRLIARCTGRSIGKCVHVFGDVHLYANHVGQAKAQLSRRHDKSIAKSKHRIAIEGNHRNPWDYSMANVSIRDYKPLGALPAPMAV